MDTQRLNRRTMLKAMGIASAGVLAGCAPAAPAPAEGGAAPAAAGGEVSLWQHTYAPLDNAYQILIAEFVEAHPEIEVLFDSVAATEFEQKLLTAVAAGSGPDIFRMPSWSTPAYVAKNIVKPMQPELLGMESHKAVLDEYAPPSSVDGWVVDGELYAIPIELSTMATWYRLDIMQEELGVGPDQLPKTWDEIWEMAAQLTKKDEAGNTVRVGFAWPLTNAIWLMHHFAPILYQVGGDFLSEDGGSCALDSDAGVAAIETMNAVYANGGADVDFSVPQALETGNQVIEFSGPFRPSTLVLNNPELEYKAQFIEGPWPQTEGGVPVGYTWGPASLTPNPDSAVPEAAYTLMKFIWDRPEVFWDVANIMTTRRIFMESETFQASPWLPTFMAEAEIARPAVQSVVYEEIKSAVALMLQRVLIEGVSPQESVALACEDVNNALTRG